MRRLLLSVLLLLGTCVAFAEESWLGIYLQGAKIGYMQAITTDAEFEGKAVKKSVSKTLIDAGMLGAAVKITVDSTSYTTAQGRPIYQEITNESAGRSQTVKARFSEKEIAVEVENSGKITKKNIPIPTDAPLVDDAIMVLLEGNPLAGAKKQFYVLDSTSISLVKNEVKLIGPAKVEVKGVTYDATLVEVTDKRITTQAYVSSKGDLIKMLGPMGMEMIPLTREEALANAPAGSPQADIAEASSITTDKPLGDIYTLKSLDLRITGRELGRLPNDAHQTVKKQGASWLVNLHPVAFALKPATITAAGKAKAAWSKPGYLVPCTSADFLKLGKKVVGNAKTVDVAAKRVHAYVNKIMIPNAGIGVLRDASEVLKTKEGVCRDYAVLTATLLRAAKVPTRLASGLINQDDKFYYHAWVEVWDGKNWVGIDSTRPKPIVTAAHIKLAHGTVEEAFDFPLLDNVKVEVLNAKRR